MKTFALLSLFAVCTAARAEDLSLTPTLHPIPAPVPVQGASPASAVSTNPAEQTLTGILLAQLAIGGETTGWALTYGDDNKTIELVFTARDLERVRDGASVTVTGVIETRRYPERGDVRVLVVTALQQKEP